MQIFARRLPSSGLRLVGAGLLLIAAAVLGACAGERPGWTYAPAPSPTPTPAASPSPASPAPSAPASPGPGASPGGSPSAPAGVVLEISAQNIAFDKAELRAPANTPFQIRFTNNDAGIPHNVAIHEGSPTGPELWRGEIFNGVETRVYDVPALPAGRYGFICTVHPNMTGTLIVE